ncbi:MAG: aldo/keto reductase [Gemmatimonadetes bacterium]|nr:aldo/keto reductase [Gemmatimonadota bacterium]
MLTRRDWMQVTAGAGLSLGLTPRLLHALAQGQIIRRAIPGSGEMLPVIGLGSSATFSQVARSEDVAALKAVFQAMIDRGATVFDTAPSYGASEQTAGNIVNEMGAASKFFWATKLNVAGRGATTADPAAAKAQVERSFAIFKQPKIDLIQVHNMGDPATQLGILKEFKKEGRVRYIGITTTSDGQYGELEQVMRNEPLDFIGIDYAVDNRNVEERILPLAQERKIGVLAYAPFGRTGLFRRVGDRPVPEYAREFDATTWAQVFLKWIVGHPAITAVTPATSQAKNMLDNIAGGVGRLPTAAHRKQLAEFIDSLPAPERRRG